MQDQTVGYVIKSFIFSFLLFALKNDSFEEVFGET